MALTEQEVIEAENFWCEYCCNFDKEHIGMDGMALCKITNTLAYSEESGKDCPFFNKPKSRFIELPCAVGDKVYWINRLTKEIETDIVVSIHQYEDGFSITTDTIGNKCTSTYSLDRFLKIMHFTKEEAEKALENKQ